MIGEDVRKVTIHFEKLMEKRIMEFQTNIFEGVEPPSSSKYNLIGTKLPTSQDVYCTGSDQVWNYGWNERIEYPYYLAFAPESARKISSAARMAI